MKTSSKSLVKVNAKNAVPKAAVKAKPASKPAAKAVKAPSKPPLKSVTPAKAKAPVKAGSKTATQAPVKVPAKASAKVPAKAPTKVQGKGSPKAVPTSKSVPTVVKTPTQPAPQSLPKAAVKTSLVTPVNKAPVKSAAPAKAQATAKAALATASEKSKSSVKAAITTAAPATVAAPVAPPVVAGDVPARATRPSARLAQITVPSMAQSVASTAAKASYLHNTPTPVMIPVFTAPAKKDAKLANNWKTKKVDQLSDAEILAMSDDDYMNAAQLAFFRRKLVLLKDDMLANAGQTTENLREDTVVVPDPADRATIEEEHALELRTRDRERKLLKKIQQSINRIDAGDYGYCDETGEPIGVGRLLARPTATLSLEAQQRRELKQKMFGD